MRSPLLRTLALVVAVAAVASAASAAPPRTLHLAGRLLQGSGTPLSGPTDITVRVFSTATLGSPCFTEVHPSVNVMAGLFSLAVGGQTTGGIPASCAFDNPYWLELQLGTDSPMTPRLALAASIFAFNADKLDGLDVTAFVTGTNITGNLGVGVTSPAQRVDVAGRLKAQTLCIAASCKSAWPSGTISSLTGGLGISINGSAIGTDQNAIQLRVTGTCAANSVITSITNSGSVSCTTIPTGAATCTWVGNVYSSGSQCRSTASPFCDSFGCDYTRQTCNAGTWSQSTVLNSFTTHDPC